MLIPASQYTQARRWTKYPATLLFALSLVWLATSIFTLSWPEAQALTETGIGVLQFLLDIVIVPLGSAVVGVFLLTVKRWALPVAALLPLEPLVVTGIEKLERISGKFTVFHDTSDASYLGAAVMDIFILAALWGSYVLMLVYLYKAWRIITVARPQRVGAGVEPVAGGMVTTYTVSEGDDSDVCMLLPEVDAAEDADQV